MNPYYVDLHVHIGRSSGGMEIKKATANNLTFENIAYEAYRKGIEVIGVVDCISPFVLECPVSQKHSVTVGVRDRLEVIKDREVPDMKQRPPYHYQVPLEFIPKVGPKTIEKLINYFGSEMNVIHQASYDDLVKVIIEEIEKNIVLAREGNLRIDVGGGVYDRIEV